MELITTSKRLIYPRTPPHRSELDPTPAQWQYLATHCRDDERRQWCAVNGMDTYDWRAQARQLCQLRGAIAVVYQEDGAPAAAGGFYQDPVVDGVWRGFAVGTQWGWATDWRTMTKTVKTLIRGLMESSAHRLELECLASRIGAQEWYLRSLGFQFEGRRRGFTAAGEDLYLYSLTSADWERLEAQDGQAQ